MEIRVVDTSSWPAPPTQRQIAIRMVMEAFAAHERLTDAGADPYDVLETLGVGRVEIHAAEMWGT